MLYEVKNDGFSLPTVDLSVDHQGVQSSTLYLKTFNIQLQQTHPDTVIVVNDLHFIIFTQLNIDFIHVVFLLHRLINDWSR